LASAVHRKRDQLMRIDAPSAASPSARLPLIDAARGVAVAAMIVYHFSWDLRYFGFITADVADEFGWRIFARLIAGSFIFIAGVSLVLATRNGLNLRRYLTRLAILVGAAAAITVATWFVFPDNFIFFGVLHHIALASVLGLVFIRAPLPLVIAASALCFVIPALLAGPAFDHPALVWLGLASYFPRTNDFVPVFPWFGVALAGMATARLAPAIPAGAQLVSAIRRYGERTPRKLLWAGRHSLAIYLLHQPILFGLVYLAAEIAPPDLLGFEPAFVESCAASCTESGPEAGICRQTCECLADRSQAEGLWGDLMRETLGQEQTRRYFELADACRAAPAAR
jgi:uncharacterized membrane protein